MRLFLKEIKDLKETEVEIRYRERDEEVENLISAVNSAHDKLIGVKDNGDCVPVSFTKILYFEAVDRGVFAYTSASVYKIRNTLYERITGDRHYQRDLLETSLITNSI